MGAQKFHVNKNTGDHGPCRATVRGCPLGGDAVHFETQEEAEKHAGQVLEKLHGVGGLDSKDEGEGIVINGKKYDSIADHAAQYNAERRKKKSVASPSANAKEENKQKGSSTIDYGTMPDVFYNTDLSGYSESDGYLYREDSYANIKRDGFSEREASAYAVRGALGKSTGRRALSNHMLGASSSSEDSSMSDDEVLDNMKSFGMEDIKEFSHDSSFKENAAEGARRGWIGYMNQGTTKIVVTDGEAPFEVKRPNKPFIDNRPTYEVLTVRNLAGAQRIKKATGIDVVSAGMGAGKGRIEDVPNDFKGEELIHPAERLSDKGKKDAEEFAKKIDRDDFHHRDAVRSYLRNATIARAYRDLINKQREGR